MRVLGVDCGTQTTGYGIIDSDGREHRMVASGVIQARAGAGLPARLLEVAQSLRRVIEQHKPDAAAVEEVFYATNVKTALKLAEVRGVALAAAAEAGLDVGEYSPLEIKTSVTGYGRAAKSQVQLMVSSLLGLEGPMESEDASDAIAVAICHATHRAARSRMEACR